MYEKKRQKNNDGKVDVLRSELAALPYGSHYIHMLGARGVVRSARSILARSNDEFRSGRELFLFFLASF